MLVLSEPSSAIDFYHGSVLRWEDQLLLFERTVESHGRVDIILANAGIHEKMEDVFADTYDEGGHLAEPKLMVLDINLRSVIFTTKLALHFFRKLNIPGSIVLTGSAASYLPTPGIPMYNTSKHGLIGLLRSLRDTLAKDGLVRLNVAAPAFTETPFSEKSLAMWQREGLPINQPADVAKVIVFLAINASFHGKGVYIAGGVSTEIEDSIEETRELWLGKQKTAWVDARKSSNVSYGKID